MKRIFAAALLALFGFAAVGADETMPRLVIGSEVYSNVTITSVTATDIYFFHARGVSNAKLKNLSPALQKHFNYNATNAVEVMKQQREANARFRQDFTARVAAAEADAATIRIHVITNDEGDLVVTKLYARSVRGERPPQINIPTWLTQPPNVDGKFVLVVFWATWADSCQRGMPHLNDLQSKFKDRLVVIGLSDEPAEEVLKAGSWHIQFPVGTDTQAQTRNALQVTGLPHSILMDPKGIVRYEGTPDCLDDAGVKWLIDKYSN